MKIREGEHYFHFYSVDSKKMDFVVYNQNSFSLTEEEITPEDLIYLRCKSSTIQKLKSEAWSCGCNWLFVLQDEGIYLMNVFDEYFWLCRKHSQKFIQMYLDAPVIHKKAQKKSP